MTTEKELMDITEKIEKDIEKKYMNLIEAEKPDLWNRIVKEIDCIEEKEQRVPDTATATQKQTKDKNKGVIKQVSMFFGKFLDFVLKGSPVREATLLTCCCLLIIGVFGGTFVNRKMKTSSSILHENSKDTAANVYMNSDVEFESAQASLFEDYYEETPSDNASLEVSQTKEFQDSGRKLIRTIDLTIQTLKFDELLSSIQSQVNALGGYIENSSVGGSPYFEEITRYANVTLRIPQEQTDAFLNNLSGEATITRRSENTEDITLNYVDLESHIKALQTEEKTLLELMEKAENLENILAIQSELSNIRYQLDSYQSQLRLFDNQVSYDTLTIYIEEVKEIEPAKEPNFFQRLANGFVNGINGVCRGIQEFIIIVVGAIPLIVLLYGISFIIIKIYKKTKKNDK